MISSSFGQQEDLNMSVIGLKNNISLDCLGNNVDLGKLLADQKLKEKNLSSLLPDEDFLDFLFDFLMGKGDKSN